MRPQPLPREAAAAPAPAVPEKQLFRTTGPTRGKPLVLGSADVVRQELDGKTPEGRVTTLARESFAALGSLRSGDRVTLPLAVDASVQGTVTTIVRENGAVHIGGVLREVGRGSFSIRIDGSKISGVVQWPAQKLGYRIEEVAGGELVIREVPLSSIICFGIPRAPDPVETGAVRSPEAVQPLLSSRPGAPGVIYLDFDGETVTDPNWPDQDEGDATIVATPQNLTDAQITEIWARTKEDFWPFNVNVTTDRTVYDAAPNNRRIINIITSNNAAAPGSGGVAYLNSYSNTGGVTTKICWTFNPGSTGSGAMTISHEVGHTFGLRHDGRALQPPEPYYAGHGTGATGWGPIMGAPFSKSLVTWSKGEYPIANNAEDDLLLIARPTNGVTFFTDEAGNTVATAAALTTTAGAITQTGLITQASDVDYYRFTTPGGVVSVTARPATSSPNLDILLTIVNASDAVLATANPGPVLTAGVSAALPGGTFYVKVQGTGYAGSGTGSPIDTGYTSYGSIGAYTLSGTVPGGQPTVITLASNPLTFLEDDAPKLVDPGATVTDNDSPDFNGGRLTVDFVAPTYSEDQLAIRNEGTGAGQISVNGTTVSFGGTAVGTFTGGTNGATPLVVTFNSAVATAPAAQALVRNITYGNVATNPAQAARSVRFILEDGDGGVSAPATRIIQVNAVNDVPTLAAITNPPAIPEDAGVQTVGLSGISAGPGETETLTVTANSDNPALLPNPTVTYTSPSASGSLSYTPVANASGVANVTVTVNDGQAANNLATQTFAVAVSPVNDAPTLNALTDATLLEDDAPLVVPFTGVSAGPGEDQPLTITATSDNLALVADPVINYTSPNAAGELTISVTPNTSGSAVVTVVVNDGQNSATTRTFNVTVLPVNDAPTLDPLANPAPIPVGAGAQTVNLSGITPGGGETQTLTVSAVSDNPAVFPDPTVSYTTPDSVGSLTYAPVAGESGRAIISVTVTDSGDTANGGVNTVTRTFTATVGQINEPPSFTRGSDILLPIGASAFTEAGWATDISPGPPLEVAGGQVVDFIVSNDNPALFAVAPALAANGSLTFTPAADANGSTVITVRAHDNGGTVGGGIDTSSPQTFTIAVATYAEEIGVYQGILQTAPGDPRDHSRFGAVRATISRRGALTAKLTLGGRKFTIKGQVGHTGGVQFGKAGTDIAIMKRKGLPGLELTLSLDVVNGTDRLTGTVTENGNRFTEMLAERAFYHAKKNAVPEELRGRYTAVFAAETPAAQGLPAGQFPQGDGIGFVNVSKSGKTRLVGTLADGSKVSASSSLSKTNVFAFHGLTDKKQGSITGALTFRDVPNTSDLDGADLVWFKPAGSKRVYASGWPGGITVDLIGAQYQKPAGEAAIPGLPAIGPDGNATVTFTDAGLPAPLSTAVAIDNRSRVFAQSAGADRLGLKINTRAGRITGTFMHPVTADKVKVLGVVLQKQKLGSGFFLSDPESGSFTVAPGVP